MDFWSYVKVFIEICGSVYVWIIVDVSKDIILEGCFLWSVLLLYFKGINICNWGNL